MLTSLDTSVRAARGTGRPAGPYGTSPWGPADGKPSRHAGSWPDLRMVACMRLQRYCTSLSWMGWWKSGTWQRYKAISDMFFRWSSGGGVAQVVKRAAEYFSKFHENEINIKICMCCVSLMAMVHIYKWVFGNQSLHIWK